MHSLDFRSTCRVQKDFLGPSVPKETWVQWEILVRPDLRGRPVLLVGRDPQEIKDLQDQTGLKGNRCVIHSKT